ncbi:YjgP/YjgQ family permease [Chryseotalea sanaruensis]|uniref:YjgP/YjgQ family permease n=1 Tax=Chryseotalea sanaruensis TaxID=2482724 RepID=A0A401UBE1_9BACT|nr:LptF/LptG family permease [Chryseotalea sanaruensis]GCC52200.1 YjgP/YjgQ family permease [Chryseotalea sanaruensis]
MKLIDKYILKRFLSTFFFVVLILLSIICVIDLTEKMDKYTKNALSASQIFSYYLDFLPWVGGLVTPITVFIATVYVCARMAGHTEVIAILSSGVSFKRMLMPYFVGAALIAGLSFWFNGWVIPNSNKDRLAFELEYLKNKFYFDKRNVHIQVAPDVYLYIQNYNNSVNTGYNFSMEKFEGLRLVEKLTANRIAWDSTKNKWTMHDWQLRKIDGIFETSLTPEAIEGFETNRKAKLNDAVIGGTALDTTLIITPKEFENDYRKFDGMTITELESYITTLKARGSTGVEAYEVELHTRFSSPFTIFILTFMGVIVSARKSRGGTGLQIALGFGLSFLYILFFMLFRTFAEAGSTPPQISVWIPNIIFAVISGLMYKYVPR